MKIFKHLDWLTVTWPGRVDVENLLPGCTGFKLGKAAGGGKFYQDGFQLACGGMCAFSTDETQGTIVVLSGEPLRALRKEGYSDSHLIQMARGARNIPRLDYAITLVGGTAKDHSPESAKSAYKRGKIKTRMRLDESYKDEKVPGGRSVYFGSRTSDQRLYVYDKAAQLGILLEAVTRVELKLKDDYAKGLAADMEKHGVIPAGDSKIKKVWNADIKWFQDALEEQQVEIGELPRKTPDFERWLEEVVLPGIAKRIETNQPAIKKFVIAVLDLLPGGS